MNCHRCHTHCSGHSSKSDVKSQPNRWLSQWYRNRRSRNSLPTNAPSSLPTVALVGMPNVGKSVLFHALTGIYATVSNYPGTTVEVSRGVMRLGEMFVNVVDTPGMYSFLPISEEEAVSKELLLTESFASVIHVVDSKNLGRMLPLTLQLLEVGLPLILALNMMDEARHLGLSIQPDVLIKTLNIPVVLMAAGVNEGIEDLKRTLQEQLPSEPVPMLI